MESLTVIIGAHNSATSIVDTVAQLTERPLEFGGLRLTELVIVENGSTDATWDVLSELATHHDASNIRVVLDRSEKGLGNALRAGARLVTGDYCLLTAADLPFGFSDLEKMAPMRSADRLIVGSKFHRASVCERDVRRQVASLGYRTVRRLMLGRLTKDTQGTIFLSTEVLQELAESTSSPGFFMTTELIFLARNRGVELAEVPVRLERNDQPSTVRIGRSSKEMLVELAALRRRGAVAGGG
jgi:dolichyl-phosphate beta-glucosyltransferase